MDVAARRFAPRNTYTWLVWKNELKFVERVNNTQSIMHRGLQYVCAWEGAFTISNRVYKVSSKIYRQSSHLHKATLRQTCVNSFQKSHHVHG